MHLRLHFPGLIDADITGEDRKTGKTVELALAEIHPNFYRPDGKPPVLYLESVDSDGNTIKRYMLSLSGQTGEISIVKREPRVPLFDKEKYPHKYANNNAAHDSGQDDATTESEEEDSV